MVPDNHFLCFALVNLWNKQNCFLLCFVMWIPTFKLDDNKKGSYNDKNSKEEVLEFFLLIEIIIKGLLLCEDEWVTEFDGFCEVQFKKLNPKEGPDGCFIVVIENTNIVDVFIEILKELNEIDFLFEDVGFSHQCEIHFTEVAFLLKERKVLYKLIKSIWQLSRNFLDFLMDLMVLKFADLKEIEPSNDY